MAKIHKLSSTWSVKSGVLSLTIEAREPDASKDAAPLGSFTRTVDLAAVFGSGYSTLNEAGTGALEFGAFTALRNSTGSAETLDEADIEDQSIDVVISNCVINLSPDKEAVFSEIWRVLKIGGELYFSDIFADRRVPEEINNNPLIAGECLGGAMYIEDFRRLMTKCGWADFRYMTSTAANIDNEEVEALIGNIEYSSRTVRAFKLPNTVEDICEQYGQTAIYRGGIVGCENYFDLDDHHRFFKDLRLDVCGNSCTYIQDTRFGKHFEIFGDRSIHFGPYEGCGNAPSVG